MAAKKEQAITLGKIAIFRLLFCAIYMYNLNASSSPSVFKNHIFDIFRKLTKYDATISANPKPRFQYGTTQTTMVANANGYLNLRTMGLASNFRFGVTIYVLIMSPSLPISNNTQNTWFKF